jgi:secreted trypsin-like serine protease
MTAATTTAVPRLVRLATAFAATVAALAAASLPAPAEAAGDGKARASIVDGYEPHPSQWPWMAALIKLDRTGSDYDRFGCGGSLVAPTVVLTAAHCVVSADNTVAAASSIQVMLGKRRLSAAGGERIGLNAIVVHPNYRAESKPYDVALLYLERPSAATPATLLDPAVRVPRGTSATVMGWGRLGKDQPRPDELRAVDLAVWSDADCAGAGATDAQRAQHRALYNPQVMLCAGDFGSGKLSCYGDSGGPLMVRDQAGAWRQIGVVSFDVGLCAGYGNPDVYAWVHGPTLQPWILEGIAGAGAYAARPTVAGANPGVTNSRCAPAQRATRRATQSLRRAVKAYGATRRPARRLRLRKVVVRRAAALRRAMAASRRAC